ncbi:MAG: PKD domain-containing protein [Bacteroidales bacterium]|nr:PKD domain-containing protein [Bacteroidales bacterium]
MKKGIILLFGYLLLFTFSALTQVVVSFDASVTKACAPVNINFTNTTTGCSGTETYYWVSGTGDVSSLENPTFTYSNGGNYTVSLTITCDGTSYTETMVLTIYNRPTADFDDTHLTGCVPYTANFTDQSTPGDGAIMAWQWYFGDGTSSAITNPSHTYNTSGNFNISLIVTDFNNCTAQYTKNAMVSVAALPVISFTSNNPTYCLSPHEVNFNANVITSFGLGYTLDWNFGDGSPHGSGSPVNHNYTSDGFYDVSLIAIDDYGCETTVVYDDYVQITTATADYLVLEGDIVCKNQNVHFQNETGYSCSWNFGDGSPVSYLNTPTHVYNTSGEKNVTFTVDPGGPCETSVSFTLTVEAVTASFTTNPTDLYSCVVPFSVEFTSNVSSNVTGYFWVFQDGGTSNLPNPTHEFTSAGVFSPALTVTTDNDCSYTYITPVVIINVPDASFVADTTEGCEPVDVEFTYTGTTPETTIVNYNWDFDNGQVNSDGGPIETSTFNAGDYTVTLTITDDNGCVGMSTLDITVGTIYEPEIDVFDNDDEHSPLPLDHIICAQDTLALWLYEWDWDDYEFTWWIDSASNEDANQEYTEHAFDQDTGWVYLHIITLYNGCRDTLFWDSLYIQGPIIKSIGNTTDCASPLDFVFTLDHIEAENWDWEFYYIEGSTKVPVESDIGSTDETYPITFPAQRSYWCKVTAYNSITGCEFIDSVQVNVSSPQAIFALYDDEICAHEMIVLNGSLSQNITEYYWDYGDGSNSGWITESAVQHEWTQVGYYTITLTVRDGNECEHSITDEIHILGPEIHITVDETYGCNSLLATFTDESLAAEPISQVRWNFNNGDQLIGTQVQYLFDEDGTYSVTVYVTTASGCTHDTTYIDWITVASVNAEFSAPNQIACIGEEVLFNATETDPTYTYTWNFGEGANVVGNEPAPSHTYSAGGKFDVYLHVDNLLGCTDEATYTKYIVIQEPTANFSLVNYSLPCYPAEPEIIQNSSVVPSETPLTYQWIMGTNDTLNVEEPEYLYTLPGTFDIILNIETSAGCTDTYSQTLVIDGPSADVFISDTVACVGQEVEFELTNMQSVDDFEWVVGGGNAYYLASFTHSYDLVPPDGYYPVTLTLTSGTCIVSFIYDIYVFDVTAGIIITDPQATIITDGACSPFDALLTRDSGNAVYHTWYVDGEVYGSGNPIEEIVFQNSGADDISVEISLAIEDDHACTDSVSTSINVFALPQVTIHNDTIICYGDELGVYATGGTSYIWSPDVAISDINSPTPSLSPIDNTMYTVQVINDKLCESFDSVYISVMQEPNIIITPEIDSILIGDTVFSNLIADQENLTYTWTPQTFISCYDCPMPYFYPLESTRYNLKVEDSLHCFRHNYYIDIIVREEYSLDVPMAFTPLGNDGNRIVYVKGFGIKKLLQFRIFNRWGEEVFYTDDIHTGWDGFYKGQIQNIDNYSYYVEAEMYNGLIQSKKGHIMLIR